MADPAALLGDTLPYTLDGLLGLRAYFNEVVWPLHGLVLILLLAMPEPGRRGPWRVLQVWPVAACWLCGGLFYQLRFAAMLDWSARYTAWLLVLQGVLLVTHSFLGGRGKPGGPASRLPGTALMVLAFAGLPLLQWISGTPAASVALAGLDPGLTALFTAGWLLARGGRWWLWPLPTAWIVMEFAIGLGLGYIPPMLLLPVTLVALLIHWRISANRGSLRP